MKKFLSVLLALMLLAAPALAAETEEAARLSVGELTNYLDGVRTEAIAAEHDAPAPYGEDGAKWQTAYAGGKLVIASDTLDAAAPVVGYALAPGHLCPRGLMIGDTLDALLKIYPNNNPRLAGDYHSAILYLEGSAEDNVEYGLITRDGQRVLHIAHGAIERSADGVIGATVVYTLADGLITEIYVAGPGALMTEEQVITFVNTLADTQEMNEYFAFKTSQNGAELDMFMREDLQFSDIDFLDLTPESAMRVLGTAVSDTWMTDSTGENLRFMQWEGVEIIFRYDANKNFISAHTFAMNQDIFDGPRGVRVGDTYFSVRERFMFGQGEVTENTTFLYGDGLTPPYATQSTSQSTAVLTYVLGENGKSIAFYITFDINWIVESFMIYYL